jgi:hypothetical protein
MDLMAERLVCLKHASLFYELISHNFWMHLRMYD